MSLEPTSSKAAWPPDFPDDVPGLFACERDRLLTLLAELSPEEWTLPTPCPNWNVLDLCSHLVGDELGWLARNRDGHHGTPPPTLKETEFAIWLDNLQNQWVQAARRVSPRVATELLRWSGPQVVEAMREQDSLSVSASVTWAGREPVPVWLDHLRELSEFWIHRQQLLQALGRSSDLRADLAGPVLDGLRWAYPYRLASVPSTEADSVIITVTDPVSRTWHLVVDSGRWVFRVAPGTRVRATLSMTTDQAWRLLSNNLPASERTALRTTGDDSVIAVLLRTRAIIGIPK